MLVCHCAHHLLLRVIAQTRAGALGSNIGSWLFAWTALVGLVRWVLHTEVHRQQQHRIACSVVGHRSGLHA